jgi:hypothetical protein
MSVTNAQIHGAIEPGEQRKILLRLNSATLTNTDIGASLLSLGEKAALRDVLNGTASRQSLNSRHISLPFKAILLSIANK